ncbi:MAG TPA: hypothetical protein VHO72_09470 [Bacteroidales bacterium]|nr:hypothetical protein [Bacteroidales bacterium]
MKTVKTAICLFFVLALIQAQPLKAQEADSTDKISLDVNADLVSRYIWRGLPSSLTPNIQPSVTLGYKNFSAQVWGSYGLSQPYAEFDVNLSYNIGAFTLSVWDYYVNADEATATHYFNFSDTTLHSVEGSLTFNGTESFPISVTLATYLWGDDKDEEGDNNYSTYLELGYERSIGPTNLKLFAGGTFGAGYYASKAALVNIGLAATRNLQLTEKTALPLSGSLIVNPDSKSVYFVFGITF